jgi:hypothetical protein
MSIQINEALPFGVKHEFHTAVCAVSLWSAGSVEHFVPKSITSIMALLLWYFFSVGVTTETKMFYVHG